MRRNIMAAAVLILALAVAGCGPASKSLVISGRTTTTIYGKIPLSSSESATWHATGGKFASTGTATATGKNVVWEAPAEAGVYTLTADGDSTEAVTEPLTAEEAPVMMAGFHDPGDSGGPVDIWLVNLSSKTITGVKYYLASDATTLQSKEVTGISIPVIPEGESYLDHYYAYTDNDFGVLLGTFNGWWPYEVTFEDGSTWTL